MSNARKNTTMGKLEYKNQGYSVLNAPLSDEIANKLETYHEIKYKRGYTLCQYHLDPSSINGQ
jgi:hypothetical protein